MKLMIGTGTETRRYKQDGWVTLDANPKWGPDILATVPPLPDEVTSNKWDEVCGIHFIEHIYLWEARQLLAELYEVVAPGGKLILEQPNIEYAAKALLGKVTVPAHDAKFYHIWALYGDQGTKDPLWCHKFGYTPDSLSEVAETAGWDKVVILPARYHRPVRDFRLEAVKA